MYLNKTCVNPSEGYELEQTIVMQGTEYWVEYAAESDIALSDALEASSWSEVQEPVI